MTTGLLRATTIGYSLDSRLRWNDGKGARMTEGEHKQREGLRLGDTPRPPAGSILHLLFSGLLLFVRGATSAHKI